MDETRSNLDTTVLLLLLSRISAVLFGTITCTSMLLGGGYGLDSRVQLLQRLISNSNIIQGVQSCST